MIHNAAAISAHAEITTAILSPHIIACRYSDLIHRAGDDIEIAPARAGRALGGNWCPPAATNVAGQIPFFRLDREDCSLIDAAAGNRPFTRATLDSFHVGWTLLCWEHKY